MLGSNDTSTLCRLPEKGSQETEEIVEEMKERDREERGTEMKVKKQKKYIDTHTHTYTPHPLTHTHPLTLPATRIAGLAQLETNINLTPPVI